MSFDDARGQIMSAGGVSPAMAEHKVNEMYY